MIPEYSAPPRRRNAPLSSRGDGFGSREIAAKKAASRRCHSNHPSSISRNRRSSHLRINQMVDRCSYLRKENALLEEKVEALSDELEFLKNLFLTHASGRSLPISAEEITRIMSTSSPGPDVSHVVSPDNVSDTSATSECSQTPLDPCSILNKLDEMLTQTF